MLIEEREGGKGKKGEGGGEGGGNYMLIEGGGISGERGGRGGGEVEVYCVCITLLISSSTM